MNRFALFTRLSLMIYRALYSLQHSPVNTDVQLDTKIRNVFLIGALCEKLVVLGRDTIKGVSVTDQDYSHWRNTIIDRILHYT